MSWVYTSERHSEERFSARPGILKTGGGFCQLIVHEFRPGDDLPYRYGHATVQTAPGLLEDCPNAVLVAEEELRAALVKGARSRPAG